MHAHEYQYERVPHACLSGKLKGNQGLTCVCAMFAVCMLLAVTVMYFHRQTVALESSLGPFDFYIRGVMNQWKPDSGELDFQFTKVCVYVCVC